MYKIPVFIILFFTASISIAQFQVIEDERIRTYDVEHIKIEAKIDIENKTLDGIVTTSIKSLEEQLSIVNVDAVNMNIKSVKGWIHSATDDPELAESFEDIKYDYDKKILKIHMPGNGLKKNFPYKYRVEYSVQDPEKGMYFITPHLYDMSRPYQVWTQGEGEDNRYWFPGYDYPNDKSTTETIIIIDSQYVTLSNGVLTGTRNNPDGTKTWHWKLDKAHSTYLVMIAAGKFDTVKAIADNIPVYSYVPAGKYEEGKLAFRDLPEMIKFYNKINEFKYPWERYSQIVVKDFIYGGMENTGATVLFEDAIYDTRTEPDYNANGLIAHELAHQWWGDIVTCRSWKDMWLNESFATYYEALFNEHQLGKDEFDYEILKSGDAAIFADTLVRKPIRILNGIGVNTYNKGSVVLNMLRYLLGDDKFFSAMNNYLTKHQFESVTTQNLIDAVNETANDDYTFFFEDWIYKAGQPEYKVKYEYDENKNTVRLSHQQIQRMDSSTVFRIHVPVEIITPLRKYNELVTVTDKAEFTEIKVDSKPYNIIFNAGNKILSKLYFDKPIEMWLYQLKSSENAIDRISAIKGLKDNLSMNEVITELFRSLRNDEFRGVRFEAAKMLENANSRKNFMELTEIYRTEKDNRVKRRILTTLGTQYAKCSDCLNKDEILNMIDTELSSEQNYYVIAELVKTRSKVMDKKQVYDFINPYLEMDSHNDVILKAAVEAMDITRDTSLITSTLASISKTAVRSRTRTSALTRLVNYKLDEQIKTQLKDILVSDNSTRSAKFIVLRYLEKNGNRDDITDLTEQKKFSNDERYIKRIDEVINAINKRN